MKNINYIIAVSMLLLLSNCGIYQSNITNAPLFKEKGEFVGGASMYSPDFEPAGVNVQAAYAVSDKVGLMMNYTNYHYRNRYYNNNNFRGFMIEPGAGYYKTLGDRGNGALGAYGLLGMQAMTHYEDGESFHYNMIRPSFLFNVGYSAGDIFDIAFSTKFSIPHYYNFDRELLEPDADFFPLYSSAEVLRYRQTFIVVEPTLTMRLGYKYGKIQFQLGIPISESELIYGITNLSLGMTFHIPSKAKRRGENK